MSNWYINIAEREAFTMLYHFYRNIYKYISVIQSMLEEAVSDDLLPLMASISAQEIHLIMQAKAVVQDLKKARKDKDENKIILLETERDNLFNWIDVLRAMRRESEIEFVGIPPNLSIEEQERTHIGEEGCDFKHSLMGWCYNYEIFEKDVKIACRSKIEENKKNAVIRAEKRLINMSLFKARLFELREKIRQDMGLKNG